jgi:hypothetical protein
MTVAMKNDFEAIQSKIKKRQTANLEIISLLSNIVEKHPELRFCQILTILNLDKDKFYEESVDTLEELKKLAENF